MRRPSPFFSAVGVSLAMTVTFLVAGLGLVWWIFRTGYRLKS